MQWTQILQGRQLRDTQPRRSVLAALESLAAPSRVHDIEEWIVQKGQSINTVTVYRILSAFEKLGLVHRHPDSRYTLCSIPDDKGHHGFLRCVGCSKTEEFVDHRLCRIENDIAEKAGFTPELHSSEIFGRCSLCSPSSR